MTDLGAALNLYAVARRRFLIAERAAYDGRVSSGALDVAQVELDAAQESLDRALLGELGE